jgi:hypothetical protein
VAGADLLGEALLFGDEAVAGHRLDRLRRGPIDLPGDALLLRVGVDSEFDRGLRFGRFGA